MMTNIPFSTIDAVDRLKNEIDITSYGTEAEKQI